MSAAQTVYIGKTISSTAQDLLTVGFTAAQLAGAWRLQVTLNSGGNMNYRDDGTSPTTTVGLILKNEENYQFNTEEGLSLGPIEFIAVSADVVATFAIHTHV